MTTFFFSPRVFHLSSLLVAGFADVIINAESTC